MGTVLAQVARHQHKYLRSQVSDMPPQSADTDLGLGLNLGVLYLVTKSPGIEGQCANRYLNKL
jgi:hypothetical protein